MPLGVKAYLRKKVGANADQKYEIRRFTVDEGVASSYDYLVAKLETVFPTVNGQNVRLYWKDNEGDEVTFSSSEELVEALSAVSDGLFKVYVELQEDKSGNKGVKGLHVGVVCDGCDGSIYGTRYQCMVCPDYDLCEKCKATGLHSEHGMKEIEKPRRHPSSFPHFPAFIPPPPPAFAPPCYFGDYQHPHRFSMGFPFHGGMPVGPFPDLGPQDGRNCARRAWKRYWRSLHRNRECKKKCKREGIPPEKEATEEPEGKNSSSSSEDDKAAAASAAPEHGGRHARHMDWIWPLFSLEVGVDGGKKFRCHKFGGGCRRTTGQNAEKAAATEPTTEEKMEECGKTAGNSSEVLVVSETTKENDSDWTLVKTEDDADNGVKESEEGIKNIKISEAENGAIVTSLSQMHAMGFYDDGKGGSLYELMVRVNGDIEKAIESINSDE